MFMLKSIGKLILGGSDKKEFAEITSGEFRIKEHHEFQQKCRFKDACLTVKKTDRPFEYVLVATRIYEEGEKELEEIENDEEYFFAISESIFFTKAELNGQKSFKWTMGNVSYEYIADKKTSNLLFDALYLSVIQCAYENKFKRPHSEASEADLEALAQFMNSNQNMQQTQITEKSKIVPTGQTIYTSDPANLFVFDASTGQFVPKFQSVLACIEKTGQFSFSLIVKKGNEVIHSQSLDPTATIHVDKPTFSFIWCWNSGQTIWTFSLKFNSLAALLSFSNIYGSCSYEMINKELFSKLDKEDADYLMGGVIKDTEMADVSESDGEADSEPETESETEEEEEEEEVSPSKPKDGQRNANLAIGYKHDRSFVSRGSSIGVFKHTADNSLEFQTNIKNIQTSKGKNFAPSKMMLHEEDSSLLLMNPNEDRKLFKMDLEYGKVVEEWEIDKNMSVTNIIPDTKYAQMTGTKTLIGINENSLFRIDPRLSGTKRVESETKEYVVKNGFTCGSTTEKGELALGSGKGDIRLYNKLDKRAKTLLPGFGDAIIGIDVSANGKWILATCKTYLLLIDAQIAGEQSTGFTKSLGSKKPTPRRLQLKPEHVAYIGKEPSFTPAKFSTGQSEEKTIITSTGPYVISWDLNKVKKGKVDDYQIKKYYDDVVADNFKFGVDKSIIVTLPDDVMMIAKKQLAPATPKSLKISKNDIVNSPF